MTAKIDRKGYTPGEHPTVLVPLDFCRAWGKPWWERIWGHRKLGSCLLAQNQRPLGCAPDASGLLGTRSF